MIGTAETGFAIQPRPGPNQFWTRIADSILLVLEYVDDDATFQIGSFQKECSTDPGSKSVGSDLRIKSHQDVATRGPPVRTCFKATDHINPTGLNCGEGSQEQTAFEPVTLLTLLIDLREKQSLKPSVNWTCSWINPPPPPPPPPPIFPVLDIRSWAAENGHTVMYD